MKLNDTVMFACNQGGHFAQMMALNELFGNYHSVLVTDNVRATKDMQSLKNIEHIEYALAIAEKRQELSHSSKKKGNSRIYAITAYLKLFWECQKIWNKYRPAAIISTGSNIAVPLFLIGWLKGSKLIFIETRAKVYSKSMTGRIIGGLADVVFVQWPEMKKLYPNALYCGTLV